jgi:cytochrome bd-type quinol oxidase subunit 2
MSVLVGIAGAIFIVLILAAYLIGKCFPDRKTRKRIMVGTIAVYSLVCIAYFGFIAFVLSGDINR